MIKKASKIVTHRERIFHKNCFVMADQKIRNSFPHKQKLIREKMVLNS